MTRRAVLVVESDPGLQRSLQILLEDEGGYSVLLADSSAQALACLGIEPGTGTVVVDLDLSDTSSLNAVQAIKTGHPAVPIIALTASPSVEMTDQARRLGCLRCLAKPIDAGELLAAVALARAFAAWPAQQPAG